MWMETDGIKVELFGKNAKQDVRCKKDSLPASKHQSTLRNGGESYMIWAYFTASEPGLAIMEGEMKSQVYIFVSMPGLSDVMALWPKSTEVNPPKSGLSRWRSTFRSQPSRYSDLNPTEMLWSDLKKTVRTNWNIFLSANHKQDFTVCVCLFVWERDLSIDINSYIDKHTYSYSYTHTNQSYHEESGIYFISYKLICTSIP